MKSRASGDLLDVTAIGALAGFLYGDDLVGATFVARGKPAPDVLLWAAGGMRTPIRDCVVIEDCIRPPEAGAEGVPGRFGDLEAVLPAEAAR